MSVVLRAVTDADFASAADLYNRAMARDRVPVRYGADELRDEVTPHAALVTDTRVACDPDGSPVGFVYTFHLPSEIDLERVYVFGAVEPDCWRRGIGRRLLDWGVERGIEQLRSSGRDLPKVVRVVCYEQQTGTAALFTAAGFVAVRWFEELLRPLDPLPAFPVIEGVAVVAWPGEREDEILVAKNASFADHWGTTPMAAHDWAHLVHGPGARPDLSFVALDAATGTVVGHCINHRWDELDQVTGRRDAWISNLGTIPGWRGRGIASGLIAASLRAFRSAGCTHASLSVDSDSPTSANRLYHSLGFALEQRTITWELQA